MFYLVLHRKAYVDSFETEIRVLFIKNYVFTLEIHFPIFGPIAGHCLSQVLACH